MLIVLVRFGAVMTTDLRVKVCELFFLICTTTHYFQLHFDGRRYSPPTAGAI